MIALGSIIVVLILAVALWFMFSSVFAGLGHFAISKAKSFKEKATEEYSNEK